MRIVQPQANTAGHSASARKQSSKVMHQWANGIINVGVIQKLGKSKQDQDDDSQGRLTLGI